jgi:hypothetical protein
MTNDMGNNAAAPAPPAHDGHEFDASQNLVIGDLAGSMSFVGTASIVLAIVMWLIGIATMFLGNPAGLAQIVQGVLMVFIGVWTRSSARSFQLVVDTKGSDIANLMNALGELRRLYNLQKWMIIVALVLIVLAFAAGIVFGILLGVRTSHG